MNQISVNINQKEHLDMILEPLQVMTQLSILSYCPLGTKLSVYNNILHLQRPTLYQGAMRWWNEDKKDDLFHLFNAIKRYYTWYKWQENDVFKYILNRAKLGLKKLKKTYQDSKNSNSISQTLTLYINILDMGDPAIFTAVDMSSNTINIDNVFKKIKGQYNKETLRVIYNALLLLDKTTDEEYKAQYIDGLMLFLIPMNKNIRNWITENLTC